MSAYLEEHLPHLRSLHAQLALPATALSSDQARLESAIRNAVTALIREREVEVDGWREAIAGEQKEISALARAVGDKGRDMLTVGRRESLENEVGLTSVMCLCWTDGFSLSRCSMQIWSSKRKRCRR